MKIIKQIDKYEFYGEYHEKNSNVYNGYQGRCTTIYFFGTGIE